MSAPAFAVPDTTTNREHPGRLAAGLALLGAQANRSLLTQGLHGIEKESLRVSPDGALALTPHPASLGSALTHDALTTDYSEALLEFITGVHTEGADTLDELDTLHRFVYSKIGDELIWNQSMPCVLPAEADIPIAYYGTSNIGRLKHVYREGLAIRYGKTMQCIAGVHFNWSLNETLWQRLREAEPEHARGVSMQDYQSDRYFALIRNFRRFSWLLMYLFGASPALDAGFVRGAAHTLEAFGDHTLYLPYATSLRMSDLGYHNTSAQADLLPNYDDLASYVSSLARAVSQPYPPYEAIGTKRRGEWVQINTNVLQIENEFYSSIRPKRVARSGERALAALAERGVQYVEVRCLDIDPSEPIGIAESTVRFIDVFLLMCALDDSPRLSAEGFAESSDNFGRVSREGRRPGLVLQREGSAIAMRDWAHVLFDRMTAAADLLDAVRGDDVHRSALDAERLKLDDASRTPSARALAALFDQNVSFAEFNLAQSRRIAEGFRARPLPADLQQIFESLARESLERQAALEREQHGDFDTFLAAYRAFTLDGIGS
ncbi:glutamate--cysteine ligase [Pararobbsia silviterrae]|uniref:Glutamate--cysteine ligase n=1 Tax=Pararobbsia silviterrae TaxID=1792498 RepID=A0A494Y7A1_9BURK|nr:glutamate--cysteine ligase [Pararobbsia silviterrae]